MRILLAAWIAAVMPLAAAARELQIESATMHSDDEATVFDGAVEAISETLKITAGNLRIEAAAGMIATGDPAEIVLNENSSSYIVRAARIEYQNQDAGSFLLATGKQAQIEFDSANGTSIARGSSIEYRPDSNSIMLANGGSIASAVLTVSADFISFSQASNELSTRGNVVFSASEYSGNADQASISSNGAVALSGSPAKLEATVDANVALASSAQNITYDPDSRLLTLKGDAQAQRGEETITGEFITYQADTGELSTTAKPGERVHVVIAQP